MAITSITEHKPITDRDTLLAVLAVEKLGKAITAFEMAETALDNAVRVHAGNVPEPILCNLENAYHMALADVLGCQKRIVQIARTIVGLPFKGDADVLTAGGLSS